MTETTAAAPQAMVRSAEFSKIKEVVSGWSGVRQYLRGGDGGQIVPVVILKDRRRYGWLFLLGLSIYLLGFGVFSGSAALTVVAGLAAILCLALALLWLWRGAIVEIEQGTTGVLSRYGKIEGTLPPGRHYLWRPWDKVEFVVDTATEIPVPGPRRRLPDAGERAAEGDRVLPEVPHRGPPGLRPDHRGLQLRPRPLQRGAGRDPSAQPPGEHREGLRPARLATWGTCRST